jgi:hypothetical protein
MKTPLGVLIQDSDSAGHSSPAVYSFQVAGEVGATLGQAFPTFESRREGRTTVLIGELPDQAALHGVLALIESLGVELVSVQRVERNQPHRTTSTHPIDPEGIATGMLID